MNFAKKKVIWIKQLLLFAINHNYLMYSFYAHFYCLYYYLFSELQQKLIRTLSSIICSAKNCSADNSSIAQIMLEASEWDLERAVNILRMGEDYFKTHYPNHYAKFQKHLSDNIEGNGDGNPRNQKRYNQSEGSLIF